MSVPGKSSDEILQELFGMCIKTQPTDGNSTDNFSLSDETVESDDKKLKHKKKKKKHKKEKKRKRNSSVESSDSRTSHKLKKAKSSKENEMPNDTVPSIKIKTEKTDDAPILDAVKIKSEGIKSDNQTPNFMDKVTGEKLTIDDVFNSFSIAPKDSPAIKIKREKNVLDPAEKKKSIAESVISSEKKKIISESLISKTSDVNVDAKKPEKIDTSLEKKKINEIFSDNEADKPQSGPKKIKIKNLKNSSVYEATMKEIEKREKLKAERYEEGELSSSSIVSSDTDMKNISDKDTKNYNSGNEKSGRSSKHKKRSKSRDKSDKKRHSHKKKKHSKSSHESRKSSEKLETDDRSHRHRESSIKHHHDNRHSRHRGHDRHYSSDNEYHDASSRRSHDSRSRKHKPSRERTRTRSRDRRKTSKHRSKSKSPEKIDKQKLLEIARKNAISLLKQGALPASVIANKDKIASIKAGGKTVDELTDFCKQLSKREAEGDDASSSASEIDSDDGKEKAFHHPFQIKERPSSIVMNIRNAVSLPTKTAQEKTLELSKQLSIQYPVSSGQQHRTTENEWVPVVREEASASKASNKVDPTALVSYPLSKPAAVPSVAPAYPAIAPAPTSIVPPRADIDIGSVVAQRLEAIRRLTENPHDPIGNNLILTADTKMQVWAESKVQPGLFTGSTGVKPLSVAELSSGCSRNWPKKLFTVSTNTLINIPSLLVKGNIVVKGIMVVKGTESKNLILSSYFLLVCWECEEIVVRPSIAGDQLTSRYEGGDWQSECRMLIPENMLQNQLITAKPVQSDKGEALMKKMGWQPGEGLGKFKQGPSAPFEISLKTDRKGLAEQPPPKVFSQPNTLQKAFEITKNKHPVSLLNEYCSRKKLDVPQYDCEEKEGAGRRKLFLFSVTVQGMRYTPRMPSTNKKQSKVEAATACLQSIGLLPFMNPTVS